MKATEESKTLSSGRSINLPKIMVQPDSNMGESNHKEDDVESFSLSSKSGDEGPKYFPVYDGSKHSSEYPAVDTQTLPWDQDTLIFLPPSLKVTLQLDLYKSKYAEYNTRLMDLNDKTFEFNSYFNDKRPKYEIKFYEKKQQAIKIQLEQERGDYETYMRKLKVEGDKKIQSYNLGIVQKRISVNS